VHSFLFPSTTVLTTLPGSALPTPELDSPGKRCPCFVRVVSQLGDLHNAVQRSIRFVELVRRVRSYGCA
jgi:hypothetical protein